MDRKKAILKDASSLSIATILTQLINIVSAILMRRFLGPVQVGVWALVQIVLTYSEYTALGASAAITLEIPLCQGKGETAKAENLKNTVFYFSLFTALATSAAILGYALWMKGSLSADVFWGLVIVSGLVILQRINGIFVALLRAFKQFSLASRQMVISGLVNAALVAILSFQFKLYGFMCAMALSFLFNIVYLFFAGHLRFCYSLDPKAIRSLIAFGLPIVALTFFGSLYETIDKIMIGRYLGLEQLGLYSIGLMTATYLYSIPNAVGVVMIPNIHEKFGRTSDKRDLQSFLDKSDLVFSTIMPCFIGLAWFGVPVAVELFLPKFMGGIPALRWLVLNVFFLAASQAYSQCIYVFRQHKFFFPIFLFSSICAISLIWLFIRAGWGIEGVAVATTTAMMVHFHVLYWFAVVQIRTSGEAWKAYLGIMARFIFMLAVLLALLQLVTPSNIFYTAALRLSLGFLIYVPFLWHLNQKMGLLRILFKKKEVEALP